MNFVFSKRGISCLGAIFIVIACFFIFIYFFSGDSSIMQKIGDTYKYRGSFTNETTAEDGIDVFGSPSNTESVKDELVKYLKPISEPQSNSNAQLILNYKDCVIVVSPVSSFIAKNVKLDPTDKTVIMIYPPKVAEKEYNKPGHPIYVHVYHGYRPYYYRRYRYRYVGVHFRGPYRRLYRRRYRHFGYSTRRYRSYGHSYGGRYRSRSYGGSSFRGGGRGWGK